MKKTYFLHYFLRESRNIRMCLEFVTLAGAVTDVMRISL